MRFTKQIIFSRKTIAILWLVFLFIPFTVFAKGGEGYFEPILDFDNLEANISSISIKAMVITSALIAVLVIVSLLKKEQTETFKRLSYSIIAGPVVMTTLFMAGSTVYLNQVSSSGGPVHWHADFKISACAQEIDLIAPTGLSNRIGTAVLHEHGDNRIHVEGVVLKPSDVSLHSFFEVIGGELDNEKIVIPTDEGLLTYVNGQRCPDGSPGFWNVFVYRTDTKLNIVRQEKLSDFAEYIPSPEGVVPPADCLIMEFGPIKDKTDNICNFYKIEIEKGTYRLIE